MRSDFSLKNRYILKYLNEHIPVFRFAGCLNNTFALNMLLVHYFG